MEDGGIGASAGKVDLITTYTQVPHPPPPPLSAGEANSVPPLPTKSFPQPCNRQLCVGLDVRFQHLLDYLFSLHWGPKEYSS